MTELPAGFGAAVRQTTAGQAAAFLRNLWYWSSEGVKDGYWAVRLSETGLDSAGLRERLYAIADVLESLGTEEVFRKGLDAFAKRP